MKSLIIEKSQILSRTQMREISGGAIVPCFSVCNSDADCPLYDNGVHSTCKITKCYGPDGVAKKVGVCVH